MPFDDQLMDPNAASQWPPPHWGIPALAGAPQLSPEEAAQIQIDPTPHAPAQAEAPQLSPEEAAQIQIDQPPPPNLGPQPGADVALAGQAQPSGPEIPPPVDGQPGPIPDQQLAMFGVPGQPPAPSVDAISGGQTGDQQPTTPEQRAAQRETQAEAAVNAMTPEQRLNAQVHEQIARDAERGRLVAEEATKQEVDAQAQLKIAQDAAVTSKQKTDAQVADAVRLANTKIDPNGYKNNRTGPQAFMDVVAAGLLGLGGRVDMAMNMMQQKTQDAIEAQRANLNNQWKANEAMGLANTTEYQHQHDLAVAQEKTSITMHQAFVNSLDAKMQDFAPDGTTALKFRALKDQAIGQMKKSQAALDKQNFDNDKSMAEAELARANAEKARVEAQGLLKKQQGLGAGAPAVKVFGTVFKNMNDIPPKELKNVVTLPLDANGDTTGFVVAPNEESGKKATHIASMYTQVDHDLNELQKISEERNGAKSAPGTIWAKWKENNEQRYDGLMIHFANVYGSLMHGDRPLPAGTLEEVLHSMPQLKGFYEGGDTTSLLDGMRNDVDTRTGKQLSVLTGQRIDVRSKRPELKPSNSNSIAAPLRSSEPVVGDNGYPRIDVRNADESLKGLFQKYQENPGLGGQQGLEGEYNRIADAQRQAAAKVRADVAQLQAKKKRTTAEEQRLKTGPQAIRDYEQILSAIDDNRKASIEDARKKAAKAKEYEDKNEHDTSAADIPSF